MRQAEEQDMEALLKIKESVTAPFVKNNGFRFFYAKSKISIVSLRILI